MIVGFSPFGIDAKPKRGSPDCEGGGDEEDQGEG